MIIKTLTIISFGKLKNKTIELSDGFNMIYGKNEAGKSTIMNFIYAMLYGFGDNRKKTLPFRERVTPWDGSSAEGKMTILLDDGRIVTIYRKCGETKRNDILKVFSDATGELLNETPEELIGINADTFERTLFIRQSSSFFQSSTDEISMRLSNLSGSGSEDVSFERAMKILDNIRRHIALSRGSGGELTRVEQELSLLLEKKNRVQSDAEAHSSAMQKLSDAKKHLEEARHELIKLENTDFSEAAVQKALIEEKLKSYTEIREECESISALYKKAVEEYSSLKKYLSFTTTDSFFNKRLLLYIIAPALISTLLSPLNKAFLLLLIISAASAGFGLYSVRKAQKKLDMIFGTHDISALSALKAKAQAAENSFFLKKEENEAMHQRLSALQTEYEQMLSAFNEKFGFHPDRLSSHKQASDSRMQMAKMRFVALSDEVSRLSAQLIGTDLSDTEATDAEIATLIEKRDYLRHMFDAVILAGKALTQAYSAMQLNFAPQLNKKASDYFRKITGGKYNSILADKDMHISVNSDIPRNGELFSGGTVDQMYLALRLALADMLFENKKTPFICDQIFMQYDSERTENTVSLLKSLSEKRQFLVFIGDENSFSVNLATEILT